MNDLKLCNTSTFDILSSHLVKGKSVGANKKDKSVFENVKLIKTDEFDDFFNLIIIDKNLLATIRSKKSLIKESDFEITSFDQEMILSIVIFLVKRLLNLNSNKMLLKN